MKKLDSTSEQLLRAIAGSDPIPIRAPSLQIYVGESSTKVFESLAILKLRGMVCIDDGGISIHADGEHYLAQHNIHPKRGKA